MWETEKQAVKDEVQKAEGFASRNKGILIAIVVVALVLAFIYAMYA